MEILATYKAPELINAMLLYVNNQKKVEKSSIAYMVGMIDYYKGLYAENLKRAEVIELFKSVVNEKTIYTIIKSEYTAKQLLNYLTEKI